MNLFIRDLFQNAVNTFSSWRNSVLSFFKSALLVGLLPFIYTTLFIPMVAAQEALIFSINIFLGSGLLSTFINSFWSYHVNICISAVYAFKLTLYFNNLYSNIRQFQFLNIVRIK